MQSEFVKKFRRLNIVTHRDVGYFFSMLIIIYCISGLALNHVDDWNPDFIITKKTITLPTQYKANEITDKKIIAIGKLVGEKSYKVYDAPTPDQVKIYYKDASLHVNFTTRKALYESVTRRPIFYQSNVLHRNSLKGWKWASDIFAIMLILLSITGMFVLKGRTGITGRGKWLILAGLIPPVAALIIQAFL